MPFHAWHEHDASDGHTHQHEEGIDQASDSGVVSTWAASAQQARSTATKTRNLHRRQTHIKGDVSHFRCFANFKHTLPIQI